MKPKLKESLESYLDQLNYEIGFAEATETEGYWNKAKRKMSKELGFIMDNLYYLGVDDEDRVTKIIHYLEVRMHTCRTESEIMRSKFREELLSLHKYLFDLEVM